MGSDHEIGFAPFRLDCNNRQLWRGEQPLALQPKPLAVLQYLAQHAGRLISKEELLQHVWAGTQVTPKALTVCIHAIRATLGDAETHSQFIETQGKQEYRFIAPLTSTSPVVSRQFSVASTEKAGAEIPHLAPGNRPHTWWDGSKSSLNYRDGTRRPAPAPSGSTDQAELSYGNQTPNNDTVVTTRERPWLSFPCSLS